MRRSVPTRRNANTHAESSLEPHRHRPRIERLAELFALAPPHPPRHDNHACGLGLAHVARERSARLAVGPEEGGVVPDDHKEQGGAQRDSRLGALARSDGGELAHVLDGARGDDLG